MAEHLTLVSLRRAVSARAGVSEKVADDFLNALLEKIKDGLRKDGQVSISGLGTFKLQDVPARESINVTTGERFTIDGYKKVVFTAGSTRGRKPAEPIDPIQKLGEQAEEIKDILSELNAMGTEETVKVSTETTEQTEVEEAVVSSQAPETTQKTEATNSEHSDRSEPKNKKQPKPFNPWLTGIVTIGVFAMLLIIAYFVIRHQIVSWADSLRTDLEQRSFPESTPRTSQPTEIEVVIPDEAAPAEPSNAIEPAETAETAEPVAAAPAVVAEQKSELPSFYDDSKRHFTEFQATETVGQDSRLAWVAKKHYGEKALWVFVYEANRDRIKNPDQVLPGMQLRIPKLPKELRDVNNPDTKALLDRLSDKYLK